MILRRGPDERDTADVDIFNGICIGDIRPGNRFFERIEVDSNQVDIIPAKVQELLMIGIRGTGE